MINILRANGGISSDSFDDYLTLKYRVFVHEQGWDLPTEANGQKVQEDSYDRFSQQFVAYDETGNAIGTIRVTPLDKAFPYKEYLGKHLKPGALTCEPRRCCFITSMAVLPAYRQKPVLFRGAQITFAKSILWHVVDELRDAGYQLCLLTAVKGASAAFFERCGCYVFEGPFFSDAFCVEVFNLGLLINDCERFNHLNSPLWLTCTARLLNAQETSIKNYLLRRHKKIMQESRHSGLFK